MPLDAELQRINDFIAEQRACETFPDGRLWADRCALLLSELKLLEREVAELTREAETDLEPISGPGDTTVI